MKAPDPQERAPSTSGSNRRALGNTAILASGEIVGRLAWFAVFIGLARVHGEAEVGVFVFAAAFSQIAILLMDLGLDRFLIRSVAGDSESRHRLTSDVLGIKLTVAIPLVLAATAVVAALEPSETTRTTVFVLASAFAIESIGRTLVSLLVAFERGGAIALSVLTHRLLAALLGVAFLALGRGVIAIGIAYLIGAAAGLAIAWLFVRREGGFMWSLAPGRWLALARASVPFAADDAFTVLLFKVDAVILALMTTEIAVGNYGAAYRVFEATLVIPYALVRAFSAMYVYLGPDSNPTIHDAFSRSIKLAVATLLPVAVAFGVLAEPLATTVFGAEFEGAAEPLRILAPAIVMLGIVSLAGVLITSRLDPRLMMWTSGGIALLNIALNVVLIPPLGATGAAIAMLASEALFTAAVLVIASRSVAGIEWQRTLIGPLSAAALMAGAMLGAPGSLWVPIAIGSVAYVLALLVIERLVNPQDVRAALGAARGAWARAAA